MKTYSFIFLAISSTSEFNELRTPSVSITLEELQGNVRRFRWVSYRIACIYTVFSWGDHELAIENRSMWVMNYHPELNGSGAVVSITMSASRDTETRAPSEHHRSPRLRSKCPGLRAARVSRYVSYCKAAWTSLYATAPVSYTECLRLETVVHELFMRLELNCCAYCAKLFVLSVYMKLTTANEAKACSYKNTPVLP